MSVAPLRELPEADPSDDPASPSHQKHNLGAERSADLGGWRRAALTALPAVRRRRKGLSIAMLGLLIAALATVLGLNIHMASTQYRVVELNAYHQDLVHNNESLSQAINYEASPQQLAQSATDLGMVMPAAPGRFDIGSGEVTGGAQPADSEGSTSQYVDSPKEPRSAASGESVPPIDSEARDNNDAGLPAESGGSESDRLNGGTIPAPDLTN